MAREDYVGAMQETVNGIEKFIELASPYIDNIINEDQHKKLESHRQNIENLKRKFENGELEVAVVGLEKAGKSMFSSAFVGETGLFPSADERCTFTSTKLQYAEKSKAVIEFYSRNEFCEKFEKMLSEVKFPNGKFNSIELATFEKHFESLRNSDTDRHIYLTHSSKTELDITDIINGKLEIDKLLDLPSETFDNLQSPELSKYITDKHISRAVKNVTFYSANLKGLENIVLHDVPGFDSPTQVHLEQTVKKLQDVDAIIMVKKIKEPSLKGGEVDVLVKNSDMDGIKLYEKLFVFGSYADSVTDLSSLNKNKETLVSDLTKSLKTSFDNSRLFTGCLDLRFEKNLKEIGSKNELEELRQRLTDYNEHERSRILEKRINKAIEEIKDVFRAIIEHNRHSGYLENSKIDSALALIDTSRKNIEKNLSEFINEKKVHINNSRLFSQEIINGIDNCMPKVDDEAINAKINKICAPDARNVPDYRDLNIQMRKDIALEVKENFVNLVMNVSEKEVQDMEYKILEILLQAVEVDDRHEKYPEIKEQFSNFIAETTREVSINNSGFKPLVERFSVDLIDTMIAKPLGSDARKDRFNKAKSDLYMLSLFSADKVDMPYKSDLVAKVLTQTETTKNNFDGYSEKFEEAIFGKISDNPSTLDSNNKSFANKLTKTLSELLIIKNIPADKIISKINALTNIPTTPLDATLYIVNNITALLNNNKNETLNNDDIYIGELLSNIKEADSKESVASEIERDMANLIELFKTAVVPAMNPELPFVGAITLYVNTILSAVKEEAYRKLIASSIKDIYHNEFKTIDDEQSKINIKSKIISEMTTIIQKLERGA